jgi:type II secretory pathway predicted ATPase ExeA
MSHLGYWKMNRSPFSPRNARRSVFTGGTIEEALVRLDFFADQRKQLGLLIGPSGIGKTTLLEHFAWKRNASHPRENTIRIDLQSVDARTLPFRIADTIGLEANAKEPNDCWSRIYDYLYSESAVGHRVLVLLDGVTDLVEQLGGSATRLLANQGYWSVVISVDDEAIVNVPRSIVEQCELKIELPAWDLGQTADFFDFVLSLEECRADLFDGQAITRIQELSEGIPRKIVQLAELALVAGAVRRSNQIHAELIDQVCEEFTLTLTPKSSSFWNDSRLNVG